MKVKYLPEGIAALGFDAIEADARFVRRVDNRLAVVDRLHDGTAWSWGFVVWSEGMATGGRRHPSWDAERACREAVLWFGKYPES